jgi:cytoskeletal protein RodZ
MKSFGRRLRYERERRQINLRSIAETTKIGVPLLEGLERDDVSRWPGGIFRKSFIRSYAEAIGLDPDPVVREFVNLFPDPLELEFATATPNMVRSKPDTTATPRPSSTSSARPLSVKLTITWSGSPFAGIGRFADWKIVRFIGLLI